MSIRRDIFSRSGLAGLSAFGWAAKLRRAFRSRMRRNQALIDLLNVWSRIPPLHLAKYRIEEKIIAERCSFLFDEDFYLDANPHVRAQAMSPLRHYVRYGAAAGLAPHPLFEPPYYDAATRGVAGFVNPVVHFHLIGRRRRISPTPLFDYENYRDRNPEYRYLKIDLFHHFLAKGIARGRTGTDRLKLRQLLGPGFEAIGDGGVSLDSIVRERALAIAREQRAPVSSGDDRKSASLGSLLSWSSADRRILDEILELKTQSRTKALSVDVVIPVYADLFATLSCLKSVLGAGVRTAREVVVIEDCAPDPRISEALDRLADRGLITLVRNPQNLGFVKSANIGMCMHAERDVVLLNSDAIVYGDWLDRLSAIALSDAKIGTVTPLTNRGTICSYPNFARDNPEPADCSLEELDRIAASQNKGCYVETPTAVGFCMYVKRAMLDEIGLFDEARFGIGYGEENDLCLRGQKAGWKDVIATDSIVYHFGSASFQSLKSGRVVEALATIDALYPDYRQRVGDYVQRDPIAPYRERLDIARLEKLKGHRNILVVSHSRGGGTEQHIQERTARFAVEGWAAFRLYASEDDDRLALIGHARSMNMPNIAPFNLCHKDGRARLLTLCRRLDIERIEIHHLADFGAPAASAFQKLVGEAGLEFDFYVHDYLSICPRINLAGPDGVYCGEPDEAACNACLQRNGNEFGATDIAGWRNAYAEMLASVKSVTAPSSDVAARLKRYFPFANISIQPHNEPKFDRAYEITKLNDRPWRIGTIGAISPIKGLNVLHACAKHAIARRLPLQFVIVGYTSDDIASRRAGVHITGAYENETIHREIADARLDAIFLSSTCPETFSYVMSTAIETGLPIFCFDIGAIGERARETERAMLLSIEDARHPDRIVEAILNHLEKGAMRRKA